MLLNLKNLKLIICMTLIFFPLFRPRIVIAFPTLNSLYWIGTIIVVILSLFLALIRLKKSGLKAFSPIVYLIILYCLTEMFAQYMNGLLSLPKIINIWLYVASAMFSDYFIKRKCEIFFSFLGLFTGLLVFVNNLSFIFVNSLPRMTDATGNIIYFWQTKNHLASLLILCIAVNLIAKGTNKTKQNHKWAMFVWINIIGSMFVFNSSTTIIGLVALVLFILLFSNNKLAYKPNLLFIAVLGLNFSIVIFRIQNAFSWIIETVLNKSLTFTGRTMIWDAAITKISRSPFYGYGESNVFSFTFASDALPAHNQLLDIAIKCGLIGLVLFLFIFVYFFRIASKSPNSRVGMYAASAMLSFMVMMITESCSPYQPWYIMMPIICNLPMIDSIYQYSVWEIKNTGKLIKIRKGGIKVK